MDVVEGNMGSTFEDAHFLVHIGGAIRFALTATTTDAASINASATASTASRDELILPRSHVVEPGIPLGDGARLLQPHLFGPLTIATDTNNNTSSSNAADPHSDSSNDSKSDSIANSDMSRTVYSVIGHPSGSSSLKVEEFPYHSLLHVNVSTASVNSVGKFCLPML